MQQQPQLQGVADLLANQGRYGDSMLVHMNPIEVQGLASMSPTGSLTVNPQTGQPEAFLPFLAPLLGGMLGSAAVGTGGLLAGTALAGKTALAGAIGSGLATAVAEGDLKQGLISGITGFGIGSALGNVFKGAEGAVRAGEKAAAQTTEALNQQVTASLADPGSYAASTLTDIPAAALNNPDLVKTAIEKAASTAQSDAISGAVADMGFQDRIGEVFSRPGDTLAALTTPQALIPAAVGEGTRLQMQASEAMDDFAKDEKRRKKADYDRALSQRDANVFDPNITPDPFATGPAYGADYAQYANAGGIVSLDPSDFRRRFNGLVEMGAPVVGMYAGGPFPTFNFQNVGMGPSNPIPAGRQAALRGPNVISPQQLATAYQNQGLPGFGPEIMYFTDSKMTDPNPYEGWRPPAETPAPGEGGQGGGGDAPPPGSPAEALALYQSGQITLEEYLDMVLPNLARQGTGGGNAQGQSEAAAEVDVPAQVATTDPATGSSLTADEIADLYGQYMNYGGGFNFNFGMQEGGKAEAFDKAFAEARRKGEATFTFNGDVFSTKTAEENLQERRARERSEDRQGPLYKRFRDNLTYEERGGRRRQKRYDDFILNELDEGRKDLLSRGAQMRVDALAKERQGMQEGGETQVQGEADRLIDLAQMAILGRLPEEEADVVIQAFVDEFGEEAFQALREVTLEQVVPGSQKEGEIVGAGGGMDDLIPGMIGDQQPVAVSPGEYIVPADVVSGIGDGSTDAGVQELDGMLDRVRMERTGTTQQPAPLAKGGMLPR